ncbi:MAG: dehydrogenase [Nitrospira sp.]|nr:dehydrogenase [Nitrospira sp.]
MIVRARAPLRLGLAGGGTDVPPFCDLYGGVVLNATIDKYAYATIETVSSGKVRFVAADQNVNYEAEASHYLPHDGILDLHKGVYNRIVKEFHFGVPLPLTLTTYCDAPAGSGLGSSSTLVVTMIKVFVELLNLPLGEYDIAHLAYEIERHDVGLHGGKQDQYAATFGGFNFIEFYAKDRVIVNPLRVKNWIISELEASLLLFYTGVSRSSAIIIEEQRQHVASREETPLAALQRLKQEAVLMKESVLKGDFAGFARSMEMSWYSKKQTAALISNPQIDEIYELAKKAGARAGKVSGAGGGGYMMFIVDPARRMDVMRALRSVGPDVFNCQFTKHGTQGWRVE